MNYFFKTLSIVIVFSFFSLKSCDIYIVSLKSDVDCIISIPRKNKNPLQLILKKDEKYPITIKVGSFDERSNILKKTFSNIFSVFCNDCCASFHKLKILQQFGGLPYIEGKYKNGEGKLDFCKSSITFDPLKEEEIHLHIKLSPYNIFALSLKKAL